MTQREVLAQLVSTVATAVDDALQCLDEAVQRTDGAVDFFSALGGSADQAHAVHDLVVETRGAAQSLPDALDEVTSAVDLIAPELTPAAAIERLGHAIDRVAAAAEAVTAAAGACQEAERETRELLRGSRTAEDIADYVDDARGFLEEARVGLDGVEGQARAQQEVYRAAVSGAVAGGGVPRLPGFADALPVRRRPDDPTAGVLTTPDGRKIEDVASGKTGPGRGGPGLKAPFRNMMAALDHAEGHAAAVMRARRLREATLYVNNEPCQGPFGCDKVLPHILPEGVRLTVYGPGGYHKTYRGTGKGLA